MKWLRALIARLRPAPITAPLPTAPRGAPTELCEPEWRTALEVTRIRAYQEGLGMGEIKGRQELAAEIAAEFSAGITEADAQRIRHRQLH